MYTLVSTHPLCGQSEREVFIAKLVSQMTLEEKVGQMTNLGLTALVEGGFWTDTDSLVLDHGLMATYLSRYGVGSIQGKGVYPPTTGEWQQLTSAIQEFVQKNTRLGIPVLMGIDAIHGAHYTADATIFPHALACGATYNPTLVKKMAQATTSNLKACGIHWNFAPVLDLAWQPLWGRIEETYSAAPFAVATMGTAFTSGAINHGGMAICLKHLAGYSFPYSGKDRSPTYIAPVDLEESFLPPFKAAIAAGAQTIMLNSGSVNGIPGHIDKALIRQVKEEWGFEGFIVSDWDDITKLVEVHRVAKDYKDATRQAVMAGMDMCMVPYDSTFSVALTALVREGAVPMARIDDAVTRILRVKYNIGLFNGTVKDKADMAHRHDSLAYQIALESAVLLKNENGILPLQPRENIVITGPGAHSINAMNGPWSRTWKGTETTYNDTSLSTIAEALKHYGGAHVSFVPGAYYDSLRNIDFQRSFGSADKIIVVVGEAPSTEKNSDIHSLHLSRAQQYFLDSITSLGIPTAIVLLQGRPRIITPWVASIDGIVHGFYPGEMGGRAIADLLYGQANFSGKLPYTYPRHDGTLKGFPYRGSDMLDASFGMDGYPPLFPFGYGLSYTTYTYDSIQCNNRQLYPGQSLLCSVKVTNTGPMPGKEVVQWYLQDEVASVAPYIWRLEGFEKITLPPGDSETVYFTISPEKLKMVNQDKVWVIEPGYFKVGVGPDSKSLRTHRFIYVENPE